MERRFFFGALAGLGGLFTLGAADPKPERTPAKTVRKLMHLIQAPASECTPAAYWDVHVDKGHTGTLYDAFGNKVEGQCIGANLASGDVLKQSLTPNNHAGFFNRNVYVERHVAPLKLVDDVEPTVVR